MEFSRQEYWSGLPFLSPGDLPNPEIESRSSTLQVDSLPPEPSGKSKDNPEHRVNAQKMRAIYYLHISLAVFFSPLT